MYSIAELWPLQFHILTRELINTFGMRHGSGTWHINWMFNWLQNLKGWVISFHSTILAWVTTGASTWLV